MLSTLWTCNLLPRAGLRRRLFVGATGRDFPVFFRGSTVLMSPHPWPPSIPSLPAAVGTLLRDAFLGSEGLTGRCHHTPFLLLGLAGDLIVSSASSRAHRSPYHLLPSSGAPTDFNSWTTRGDALLLTWAKSKRLGEAGGHRLRFIFLGTLEAMSY